MEPIPGFVVYRSREYAVDFVPAVEKWAIPELSGGGATLQLTTLQFLLGLNGDRVLYAFGYCPHTSWIRDRVDAVPARPGGLVVRVKPPLSPGGATMLDETSWGRWTYDSTSSMLSRKHLTRLAQEVVAIADGVTLGIGDQDLTLVQLVLAIDEP